MGKVIDPRVSHKAERRVETVLSLEQNMKGKYEER